MKEMKCCNKTNIRPLWIIYKYHKWKFYWFYPILHFIVLQSCVEELYKFNRSSLENSNEKISYHREVLDDKIKQLIELMKGKEGIFVCRLPD